MRGATAIGKGIVRIIAAFAVQGREALASRWPERNGDEAMTRKVEKTLVETCIPLRTPFSRVSHIVKRRSDSKPAFNLIGPS